MIEEEDRSEEVLKGLSANLSATSDVQANLTSSVITSSQTTGDQTFRVAETQIKVEDAAHRREVEKQRLDHELSQDLEDRKLQRWREKATFIIVTGGVVLLILSSVVVAAVSKDPTRQAWAQGFASVLVGAIGGAFAGYLVGDAKK